MAGETTNLGMITIAPRAVATIAAQVALRSYGVVGMAPKSLMDGIADTLARDPRHGVEVRARDDQVLIDLFIIVEYGTRIATVAGSVANAVRYKVERAIGMPVSHVNVHVQGLRISNID